MSKRKFATPTTYVPGARIQRDPDTLAVLYDKKGRPLWDMPKPQGMHETLQVVEVREKDGDRVRKKKVKQMTQFPVYRGANSLLAREIRAKIRREVRIRKAKGHPLNPKNIIKRVLGGNKNGKEATAAVPAGAAGD